MDTLNLPLLTWSIIVTAMAALVLFRLFHRHHEHKHSHLLHRKHLIEIGSDDEEFYVPGDPVAYEKRKRSNTDF